jgi:hypothetical protein
LNPFSLFIIYTTSNYLIQFKNNKNKQPINNIMDDDFGDFVSHSFGDTSSQQQQQPKNNNTNLITTDDLFGSTPPQTQSKPLQQQQPNLLDDLFSSSSSNSTPFPSSISTPNIAPLSSGTDDLFNVFSSASPSASIMPQQQQHQQNVINLFLI